MATEMPSYYTNPEWPEQPYQPNWEAFPWAEWFTVDSDAIFRSRFEIVLTYWQCEPAYDTRGAYWALSAEDAQRVVYDGYQTFLGKLPAFVNIEVERPIHTGLCYKLHKESD